MINKLEMLGVSGFLALAVALAPPPAKAQDRPEFVLLPRLMAALFRPDSGPAPHVGIVYENGLGGISSSLCSQMAKRGFLVLCSAPRQVGRDADWEHVAIDVKNDVQFLRAQPGITKVVLYGHSGGGAVASFYEAVAENGAAFCKSSSKLMACGDDVADLPKADAVLFPDAHPGDGVMNLRMLNPSLVARGDKLERIADLDPFNPDNGYNPKGTSHYTAAFQARYVKAQAEQMDQLIGEAIAIRAKVKSGEITNPAMGQIVLQAQSFNNHLDQTDPDITLTMSTLKPRKFLRNDGAIVTQMIKSTLVGTAAPPPGPVILSAADFLDSHATRATDSLDKVDYCSSNSNTACNIQYIHVPVLFIAMGANTFISDEERMYERSPSVDKDYIVVEGAQHSGAPCKECEVTAGQFSNSEKNMYDYMRDWINKRFP